MHDDGDDGEDTTIMINMLVAICNFFTCVRVHACVCMCGDMREDTPHATRPPPPTCPLPRAEGSPKHQNSISLELIEVIQFSLNILYP